MNATRQGRAAPHTGSPIRQMTQYNTPATSFLTAKRQAETELPFRLFHPLVELAQRPVTDLTDTFPLQSHVFRCLRHSIMYTGKAVETGDDLPLTLIQDTQSLLNFRTENLLIELLVGMRRIVVFQHILKCEIIAAADRYRLVDRDGVRSFLLRPVFLIARQPVENRLFFYGFLHGLADIGCGENDETYTPCPVKPLCSVTAGIVIWEFARRLLLE